MRELKFDGYRMLCRIDRGKVTFWSRNEKEWTAKSRNVVESATSLPLTTAILDGEIVMVDAQGHSSFQKLQRAMGKSATSAFVYEVFDLSTIWTEPKLIAEVQFMEWTSDGSIRHPSFQGLREDKAAKDVVRELPGAAPTEAKKRKPVPNAQTKR